MFARWVELDHEYREQPAVDRVVEQLHREVRAAMWYDAHVPYGAATVSVHDTVMHAGRVVLLVEQRAVPQSWHRIRSAYRRTLRHFGHPTI